MHINFKSVLENSDLYFHTPSSLAKTVFYYLISIGEFICDDSYHVKRESYNSFLIMYIKKGQGTVCFDNKSFIARENDLVLINCYKQHEYYTNTGWETQWIHFDGNNSKELFDVIYSFFGCIIPMQNSIVIPKYLNTILEGFRSSNPSPEPLVSCYIHRMLSELILLNRITQYRDTPDIYPILDAVKYIEQNFNKKLSLSNIAAHISMSVFHFSREFKRGTGYSPYEYLLKTRIDRAKTLLTKTKMTIKEITFDSGFSSESSFVFTFHKKAGVSPGEFRKTPF